MSDDDTPITGETGAGPVTWIPPDLHPSATKGLTFGELGAIRDLMYQIGALR